MDLAGSFMVVYLMLLYLIIAPFVIVGLLIYLFYGGGKR